MKTNYFTIVSFALFLLLNLTSCNETTPPTVKKTKLHIDTIELTSFDFNHPNNNYDDLLLSIQQGVDENGNVPTIYNGFDNSDPVWYIQQEGLPYRLLYDEVISDDFENLVYIVISGYDGANFTTLERFSFTPSKEDKKTYTFNSSTSPVPFSLKVVTLSE
jgi:hypothetical protein